MVKEDKDFLDDWAPEKDADADKTSAKGSASEDGDDDEDPDNVGDTADGEADKDADKDDDQADDKDQSDDDAENKDDADGEPAKSDEPDDAKTDADRVPTASEFRGMLDEREKRQKFEAENEELKRKLASHEKEQDEKPTPDAISDPEGFQAHQKAELAALEQRTNMNAQEYTARTKHSDKVIDAALDAMEEHMKTNPAEYRAIVTQKFPYEALVKWHADQSFFAEVEAAGGREAWLKAQETAPKEPEDNANDQDADEDDDDAADDDDDKPTGKKLVPSLSGKGAKDKLAGSKVLTDQEAFKDLFPR